MKTKTIILGALCLLAICAVPMASADITAGACTDPSHCLYRSVSSGDLQCSYWESPTTGSIVDQPSCRLNF